jgi:hypothetical protein
MHFSSLDFDLLIYLCVLCCSVFDVAEPSKPAEQKPSGALVLPSVIVVVPNPPPSTIVANGGAGLVACSYADARSTAQWVFWFLDHMKNTVDDQEGNQSHFFNSLRYLYSLQHVLISVCSLDCQAGSSQQGSY